MEKNCSLENFQLHDLGKLYNFELRKIFGIKLAKMLKNLFKAEIFEGKR